MPTRTRLPTAFPLRPIACALTWLLVLATGCGDDHGSGAAGDAERDQGSDAAEDAELDVAPHDARDGDPDAGPDGSDDALDAPGDTVPGDVPDDGVDAAADLGDGGGDSEPGPDGSDDAVGDADPDGSDASDTESDADAPDTDGGEPVLFDMALVQDPSTLDCRFENRRTATRGLGRFDLWDVSFVSYEVNEGVLTPIRLRGFAARPAGAARGIPGVVNVHGLGGHATESMATGPAQLLGYFTLAATGPGGGSDDPRTQSEGRPSGWDGGYRIFDVVTDPRGSWLWAHAIGAMRALGCLSTHADVDTTRLGMTGFSGGGIATLISVSVDDRIRAAVPLSGTGGWPESAVAPASWFHALLTAAELDTSSPEWAQLTASIDPAVLVPLARAPVMLVNGSTDEFFPLASHLRTYAAINPAVAKRTSIAANFDHGCYSLTGGESAGTIEARATLRAEGAQRLWFHHHFGTDPNYSYLPAEPRAGVGDVGGFTLVTVEADPGGANLRIDAVRIWASVDGALTFWGADLSVGADGRGAQVLAVPYNPAALWFVDVEYRTRAVVAPERFSLSTAPSIPPGHVPAPRGITTCLP